MDLMQLAKVNLVGSNRGYTDDAVGWAATLNGKVSIMKNRLTNSEIPPLSWNFASAPYPLFDAQSV